MHLQKCLTFLEVLRSTTQKNQHSKNLKRKFKYGNVWKQSPRGVQ